MSDPRCQAAAMDAAVFGDLEESVPPCDELGDVDVRGYHLCAGCAEALEALVAIGDARRRERRG